MFFVKFVQLDERNSELSSAYLSDVPYVEELNIAVTGDDIAELLEEELHTELSLYLEGFPAFLSQKKFLLSHHCSELLIKRCYC